MQLFPCVSQNESHCVRVFRRKGLWVEFWMPWFCYSILPRGTVIVACVCQSVLETAACLSVFADAPHMELFTPSTLQPAGHAFLSLCVLMFGYFIRTITLCLLSLFTLLFISSPPLPPPLPRVFLCAISLLYLSSGSLFSTGEAVFVGSRWQAWLYVCVCIISVISAVWGQVRTENTHSICLLSYFFIIPSSYSLLSFLLLLTCS